MRDGSVCSYQGFIQDLCQWGDAKAMITDLRGGARTIVVLCWYFYEHVCEACTPGTFWNRTNSLHVFARYSMYMYVHVHSYMYLLEEK